MDQRPIIEGRQDDNTNLRPPLFEDTCRLNTIHAWHTHIHQHYIGRHFLGREEFDAGQRFLTIASHADHFQVRLQFDQLAKALAQQALVIHNHYADMLIHDYAFSPVLYATPALAPSDCRCLSGISTVTRQPRPGSGPACTVPPRGAARSRMPSKPKPGVRSSLPEADPWPLSNTVSSTWLSGSSLVESRRSTFVACACLRILVSASCAQRYSAMDTSELSGCVASSTSSEIVVSRLAAANSATSASRRSCNELIEASSGRSASTECRTSARQVLATRRASNNSSCKPGSPRASNCVAVSNWTASKVSE